MTTIYFPDKFHKMSDPQLMIDKLSIDRERLVYAIKRLMAGNDPDQTKLKALLTAQEAFYESERSDGV